MGESERGKWKNHLQNAQKVVENTLARYRTHFQLSISIKTLSSTGAETLFSLHKFLYKLYGRQMPSDQTLPPT